MAQTDPQWWATSMRTLPIRITNVAICISAKITIAISGREIVSGLRASGLSCARYAAMTVR